MIEPFYKSEKLLLCWNCEKKEKGEKKKKETVN